MASRGQNQQDKMKYEIADELGLPHATAESQNVAHANAYLAGPVGGLMTKQLVAMGEQLLIQQKKK